MLLCAVPASRRSVARGGYSKSCRMSASIAELICQLDRYALARSYTSLPGSAHAHRLHTQLLLSDRVSPGGAVSAGKLELLRIQRPFGEPHTQRQQAGHRRQTETAQWSGKSLGEPAMPPGTRVFAQRLAPTCAHRNSD